MRKDKTLREEFFKKFPNPIFSIGDDDVEMKVLRFIESKLEQAKKEGRDDFIYELLKLPKEKLQRGWLLAILEKDTISANNGKKARPKTTPPRKDRGL